MRRAPPDEVTLEGVPRQRQRRVSVIDVLSRRTRFALEGFPGGGAVRVELERRFPCSLRFLRLSRRLVRPRQVGSRATSGLVNCIASRGMRRVRAAALILAIALATSTTAQDAPADAPPKPWSSSFGAGLTLTSGNRDTTNINVSFNTEWDPKTDRLFKADALYLLGEADGEKQVDKATASARYERLFEERAFWFGEVRYLRDPFRDIAHLLSPLAGAGYHLLRDERRKLTVDGAIGGTLEDNQAFGREVSGAVQAGESFEWTLTPTSKLTQRMSALWKADDFSDALYHFEAGVASQIATRLELKLSFVHDYKTEPPSPEIEKGDSALFAAVLVKF